MKHTHSLLICIALIVIFSLSGCKVENQTYEIINGNVESLNDKDMVEGKTDDINEKYFLLGRKIYELSEIDGINDIVAYVNGYPVTRKEIVSQVIISEILCEPSSKERVQKLIRNKVVETEAIKRDIKPSTEKIEEYLNQTKEILSGEEGATINNYIEGRNMTQQEYIDELRESEYIIQQRVELWNYIKETNKSYSENNYEKYVDGLMKKAKIKYLDEDLKKIMSGK